MHRSAAFALEARVPDSVSDFFRSVEGRILAQPGEERIQYQRLSGRRRDGENRPSLQGADGMIEFVDFKPTRYPCGAAKEDGRTPLQVSIYAYLISRLYGQSTVRGTPFSQLHSRRRVYIYIRGFSRVNNP